MDEATRNGFPVDLPACPPGVEDQLSARLRNLPWVEVMGRHYPLADTRVVRLLGLSGLARAAAGPGLVIPRCSSVHTFGMRFALDVVFLGRYGEALDVRRSLGPRRIVRCRGASAVLELPSDSGGAIR